MTGPGSSALGGQGQKQFGFSRRRGRRQERQWEAGQSEAGGRTQALLLSPRPLRLREKSVFRLMAHCQRSEDRADLPSRRPAFARNEVEGECRHRVATADSPRDPKPFAGIARRQSVPTARWTPSGTEDPPAEAVKSVLSIRRATCYAQASVASRPGFSGAISARGPAASRPSGSVTSCFSSAINIDQKPGSLMTVA